MSTRGSASTGEIDRTSGQLWRWALIAAATLILCSCQAPMGPEERLAVHRSLASFGSEDAELPSVDPPVVPPSTPSPALAQATTGAPVVGAADYHVQLSSDGSPLPCPAPGSPEGVSGSGTGLPMGMSAVEVGLVPRADEWVCDGGDQQPRAWLNLQDRPRSLEAQDTVVHYRTPDGRAHVTASNRVCIYAPRFAAVRKVTMLNIADDYLQARVADQPLGPDLAAERQGAFDLARLQPTVGHRQLGVPTPLRDRRPGLEVVNRQPMREFETVYAPHEDFQLVRSGTLEGLELIRLIKYVDAAITWTHDAAVQVVLGSDIAQVTRRAQPVGEIYQVQREGAPELRIIKLASTGQAQPGEIVEFTLRVDNLGGRPADDVTILDNLTARLQYIPDSAQSSLPAEFSAEPNDHGSVTLRWDLRETLAPQQGWILRFRCRVQ